MDPRSQEKMGNSSSKKETETQEQVENEQQSLFQGTCFAFMSNFFVIIRYQTEIMKLKLAKQSGWLTQEEYDEELKRSIQYWNGDFREAAYDLDAEDDYYDDEHDEHDADDNANSHVSIADNGDSARQTEVPEESTQLHAETTKSQDSPHDKEADQASLQLPMQNETELKCDAAESRNSPAAAEYDSSSPGAYSPVGSLPSFSARFFGRGYGSFSGFSYAAARASVMGGGTNFSSAPAFFGPEGHLRRTSDLLIDDESEEDIDTSEFHSQWKRDI